MYFLLLTVLLSGTNLDSGDMNQEYRKYTLTYFLSDTLDSPFNKITPDTNLVKMPVYDPPSLDLQMPVFKPPPGIDFDMPVIGKTVKESSDPLFQFPDSIENPLKKRPSGINRDD